MSVERELRREIDDVRRELRQTQRIARYPLTRSSSGATAADDSECDCRTCVDNEDMLTNGCGSLQPAAKYWQVDFEGPLTECCDPGPISNLLTYYTGCTWRSPLFECDETQYRWNLTYGNPWVELTLALGDGKQIIYRKRADEWSGVCANQMTLWQPNNLPAEDCAPPCRVCVKPINQWYCSVCPEGGVPRSVTVEFSSGFTAPFGGQTYELDEFFTSGAAPPTAGTRCHWGLIIPWPEITPEGSGASYWALIEYTLNWQGSEGSANQSNAIVSISSSGGGFPVTDRFTPTILFSPYPAQPTCGAECEADAYLGNNWPGLGIGIQSATGHGWTAEVTPSSEVLEL